MYLFMKKKFKGYYIIYNILTKQLKKYNVSKMRKGVKCQIPLTSNQIKFFLTEGIIIKTHLKSNNESQTLTFLLMINKKPMKIMVPTHSPVISFLR